MLTRSLRAETHLGPDGTRPEQNKMLKPGFKAYNKNAALMVYMGIIV